MEICHPKEVSNNEESSLTSLNFPLIEPDKKISKFLNSMKETVTPTLLPLQTVPCWHRKGKEKTEKLLGINPAVLQFLNSDCLEVGTGGRTKGMKVAMLISSLSQQVAEQEPTGSVKEPLDDLTEETQRTSGKCLLVERPERELHSIFDQVVSTPLPNEVSETMMINTSYGQVQVCCLSTPELNS